MSNMLGIETPPTLIFVHKIVIKHNGRFIMRCIKVRDFDRMFVIHCHHSSFITRHSSLVILLTTQPREISYLKDLNTQVPFVPVLSLPCEMSHLTFPNLIIIWLESLPVKSRVVLLLKVQFTLLHKLKAFELLAKWVNDILLSWFAFVCWLNANCVMHIPHIDIFITAWSWNIGYRCINDWSWSDNRRDWYGGSSSHHWSWCLPFTSELSWISKILLHVRISILVTSPSSSLLHI